MLLLASSSRDSRSVPIGCRAHYKVGDPVLVDQAEDAIVDLVVLREEEFRLDLGPAAEGEVGEEDSVRLFLLGLAMGEHQLLRGLGRRDLPHCIFPVQLERFQFIWALNNE